MAQEYGDNRVEEQAVGHGGAMSRRELLDRARVVVVKVGTQVLTDDAGKLSAGRIAALAAQIARLAGQGRRVILVSSGAIGAGVGRLGLSGRPTELPALQACAAVGQPFLMTAWEGAFAPHGMPTAQVLLTASDFDHRARYLNMRNTLTSLFELGCVPIINENDTTSVAEIRFGDNDTLAALVAGLVQADLLVLLSGVDGLFEGDPRLDPQARRVDWVPDIDAVMGLAQSTKSRLGTGGMRSKLKAARLAVLSGTAVWLADGGMDQVLDRLRAGDTVGTLFAARRGTALPAWKRWLGFSARPQGSLVLDDGARKAVLDLGKSLLPIGVAEVQGHFGKGSVVSLRDRQGAEFARGLCNFGSTELEKIRGLRTEQIQRVVGVVAYDEAVHRDNLVLTGGDGEPPVAESP